MRVWVYRLRYMETLTAMLTIVASFSSDDWKSGTVWTGTKTRISTAYYKIEQVLRFS